MNINEYRRWVKDDGDKTKRLDYNLNEDSLVFDVGGYHGNWANEIYKKYGSNIYVFEPIDSFCNIINEKFINNDSITVLNFGLSNKNEKASMSIDADSSGIFNLKGKNLQEIELKNISEFIIENNIKIIDLMKINIEGGEYDLLLELIKNKHILNIKNIQVQFHDFIDNAIIKREKIQLKLRLTHDMIYNYEFVWENWKLKTKNI